MKIIYALILIVCFACENNNIESTLELDSTSTMNSFAEPQNFKEEYNGCYQESESLYKPIIAFKTKTYDQSLHIEIGYFVKPTFRFPQVFVRTANLNGERIDSTTLSHSNIIQGIYMSGICYSKQPCVKLTSDRKIFISDSITVARSYRAHITILSGEKVMATLSNDTTYFDTNEYIISPSGKIEECIAEN